MTVYLRKKIGCQSVSETLVMQDVFSVIKAVDIYYLAQINLL